MDSKPVVKRRKSFWQIRPAIANQSGSASRAESSTSLVLASPLHPASLQSQQKTQTKQKIQRIFDRMRWWNKKKKIVVHNNISQTYLRLEANHTNSPPDENPFATNTEVSGTISRAPSEAARVTGSPEPIMTLDGTQDPKPTRSVVFVVPNRKTSLLRHRSFFHLRNQAPQSVNATEKPALKHSVSSPGLLRKKLSQHFQGTVIRRPPQQPDSTPAHLTSEGIPAGSPSTTSGNVVSPPLIPSCGLIPYTMPAAKPSLRTVEITAATKTYIESHFAQLLSYPSTRSARRRTFENELSSKVMSEQERRVLRDKWVKKESEYLRSLRSKKLSVGDFELIRVIGKGSFGVVKLVHQKQSVSRFIQSTMRSYEANGTSHNAASSQFEGPQSPPPKVYALKVMPKADMLLGGQEGHIRAERDFLVASAGSKWIVPLIAAFQDEDNLYLVMEYLIGGDFLGLLIERTVLSEEMTRFYIAEMVLCIEEAHGLGYIHRDIKPDNFIFTSNGHLKLCDFGLAFSGHRTHDGDYLEKQRHALLKTVGISVDGDTLDRQTASRMQNALAENISLVGEGARADEERAPQAWIRGKREMAKSVVGTNQYMAPEVIRGEPYDGRCDWWSLGIILYECLYGFTPFYCGNRLETRQKILNWPRTLTFPTEPRISGQAYSLIASLLCEKQQRLTSRMYAENDGLVNGRPARARPPSATYSAILNEIGGDNFNNRTAPTVVDNSNTPKNHVLSHDAAEIKAHPFFKGINWKNIHTQTAPFIPDGLSGADDTKYFDFDSYDYSTASGDISQESQEGDDKGKANMETGIAVTSGPSGQGGAAEGPGVVSGLQVKKRARDKLLRDPVHGKDLLELRKEVAFWGYTYRGPKGMNEDTEDGDKVGTKRRVTLGSNWPEAGNGNTGVVPAVPAPVALARPEPAIVMPRKPSRVFTGTGSRVVSAAVHEYSGTTVRGEESC